MQGQGHIWDGGMGAGGGGVGVPTPIVPPPLLKPFFTLNESYQRHL